MPLLNAVSVGQELGHGENTSSSWTTTRTTPGENHADNKPPGLSKTIVGKGRPVEIDVYFPSLKHSTNAALFGVYILIDGVAAQYAFHSAPGASGVSTYFTLRKMLNAGTSYLIEVGVYAVAAGTITSVADATFPATLDITQR